MTEWFRRFPGLYRADTLHLNLAEHGAYNLLIDWYMQNRRPVPRDDQAIVRILGVSREEWLAVAPKVRRFFVAKGSRLHHKRCDAELDYQDRRLGTRSEVARKGAEARWRDRPKNTHLGASSMPEAVPPGCFEHAGSNARGEEKEKREEIPPPNLVAAREGEAPKVVVMADAQADKIVLAFESLRQRHWPTEPAQPEQRAILRSEARHLLSKGANVDVITEELDRQMTKTARQGKTPPSRLNAYRHSLNDAIAGHRAAGSNGSSGSGSGLRRASVSERRKMIEAEAQRRGQAGLTPRDRREFLLSRGVDPHG